MAQLKKEESLDPDDWTEIKTIGTDILSHMLEYHENIEKFQPQFITEEEKSKLYEPVPFDPQGLTQVWQDYLKYVDPSKSPVTSPRFWAFVGGTGSAQGMLAEILTNGMNSGGLFSTRSNQHVTIQVLDWLKELMEYPLSSSGILVSGGSMANFIGLSVARNAKAKVDIKKVGLQGNHPTMTAYVSKEGHHCLFKAIEILGIGRDYVRWIPTNDEYQMDLEILKSKIREDRESGFHPFCVIGNAGTVNTGAFDDFNKLSKITTDEDMWLHVDGAFGAWAKLSKTHRGLVDGMEKADSLAFDMHKWMYMPYVIGCTLVRDAIAHNLTFSYDANYLEAADRIGESDYSESSLGMQLSDSFRAFKPWFLLKMDGVDKYARLIQQNIDQACYLAKLVDDEPSLELVTPCTLNIVCFRYHIDGVSEEELVKLNQNIWWSLYQKGFLFSDTYLNGRYTLRACITNHRTKLKDLDNLVGELVKTGKQLA